MKKILALFFVFLMLCGCSDTEKVTKNNPRIKDAAFLIGKNWENNNESCVYSIGFYENGEFSNSCGCGSPVGNGDMVESFSYSAKDKTVTLKMCDDLKDETAKILYYDEHYLIIDIWDEAVVYENLDNKLEGVRECALQYTKTDKITKAQLAVLGFENGKLKVSANDYDGDAARDFTVWELPCTADVEFCDVSVTVQNGEEEVEYKELSKEDCANIGEFYTGGFVEINSDGFVSGVTFYGELIIY